MIRSAPALALAVLLASPASAQQIDSTTTVFGVVVDAVTSNEVRGALVRLSGDLKPVLTDTFGAFEIPKVPAGSYVLTVTQYGYEPATASLDVVIPQRGYLQVDLEPKPFAIEGVSVVANRLASFDQSLRARRNAAPVTVVTLGQNRLVGTSANDLREFLMIEASVYPVPCATRLVTECIERRGRPVRPRICIDEAPLLGGLVQLATYRPEDFYLVEVYSAGAEIRAYTHGFVDRMLERPQSLTPSGIAC